MHTRFWWGELKERDHLKDKSVGGRIILKWVLKKNGGSARTGLIWLRIRISGGHGEYGNEQLTTISPTKRTVLFFDFCITN
jgi:hypothetical protein